MSLPGNFALFAGIVELPTAGRKMGAPYFISKCMRVTCAAIGAPMMVKGATSRWGVSLGKGLHLEDSLWGGLTDTHVRLPMGVTAENLAKKYSITREECDDYALRSHLLWSAGHASGAFDAEIAPVPLSTRKGPTELQTDEHPRPDTSIDKMSQLPPVFEGVCTAGNSSGICDGAGALIVTSEATAAELGQKPLARIVSWATVGVDPAIMGIGPADAIRKALDRASLKLEDISRIEINEAFAAQVLACLKEIGLDREITNVNGGAIALGHPLGASGSRILATLAHHLAAEGKKGQYAVGAACIGGGQGIAVVLQAC